MDAGEEYGGIGMTVWVFAIVSVVPLVPEMGETAEDSEFEADFDINGDAGLDSLPTEDVTVEGL